MIKAKGFTLIEIALALVIIGLLITGGTFLYGQQYHSDKINQTHSQLNNIHDLMLIFVQTNGYLPCPDTDGDGLENRKTDGACQSRQGRLPGQTLGIDSKDAWGTPFYYRVNARAEDINRVTDICQSASVFAAVRPDGAPEPGTYGSNANSSLMMCDANKTYYCRDCIVACGTTCVDPSSPAFIDPRPNSGLPPYFHSSTQPVASENDGMKSMTIVSPSGNTLNEVVVAVVVSFGQNGKQTWGTPSANVPSCPASLTSEEQENCDNDQNFIDGSKAIDDFLVGITLREVKKVAIDSGLINY